MIIRPAQDKDATSLAALSIEVWLGTYLKYGIAPRFAEFVLAEFTPAKLRAQISNASQHIFVAQAGEGPVGYIRLDCESAQPSGGGSTFEIATFYIQPCHHGKGIGKALLTIACAQARRLGACAVWLTTNAQNDPAIGFYLAQGFDHIGQTEFVIGDEAYLNNLYSLELA